MARRIVPDLSVSTDIIVGFPGETEEDFQATMDVVAAARFDGAFTFQFSPRPGTPAATLPDQVPPEVVQERFDRLVELQNRIGHERNQAMVGRIFEVMVEGPSRKDAAIATTRTRGGKLVHVPGTLEAGAYLPAVIDRAAPHHLLGSLVEERSAS